MGLTMRMYEAEDDYWRIRDFLRRILVRNGLREFSWHVARFAYWWCHGMKNMKSHRPEESVFIWETKERQIAAVLNPEEPGQVFLQVDPDTSNPALEDEMVVLAEEHLAVEKPDGGHKLLVWADSHDALRQGILTRRGYAKGGNPEHQRRRSMSMPVRDVPVKQGYTVRALGGEEELPVRSWASWKSFHPSEPDERYEGWEWYRNIQSNPLYRHDLDIVAVTSGGEVASFCTIWYDDATRTAYFEPVGTAFSHQRRGLAKAVMTEGLHRLERMGAKMAFVSGYSVPANALYSSVGFIDYDLSEPWKKEF